MVFINKWLNTAS